MEEPRPTLPRDRAEEHRDITTAQLIEIVQKADILRVMGENHLNELVVDFMPPTQALIRVRLQSGLSPVKRTFETQAIQFTLESQQIGGVIYAALTVGDRVVIEPWRWESYEHLAGKTATILDAYGRRVS